MSDESLTEQIRAMKPKTDRLFEGAKSASVKAIASRIGSTSIPSRKYVTESEREGVRVYRVK
jgi:hypothetical protein